MTGQEFQDKLDALVVDLQTVGKGQTINVMFRGSDNIPSIFPLSSTSAGVVNTGQLAAIQAVVDVLKPIANTYSTLRAPVTAASEAFNTRRATHQTSIDAAAAARTALATELAADQTLSDLGDALETAKNNPNYIAAVFSYNDENVSENYGELIAAKGKYVE